MKATILAIGDELVAGLTVDTNSSFIAQLLRAAGIEVTGVLTVADDEAGIVRALGRALEDSELVVTTGGLGPTEDDLTTACVAQLAGVPLELHEPSLEAIARRFAERGLEMTHNNRKQALFPRGATVLPNPDGTAPGFVHEVATRERRGFVASLPGVPREMRRMAEEGLITWVAKRLAQGHLGSRTFSTFGLSESRLDELLKGVMNPAEGRLSFRAAFPRLQARISVTGYSESEVASRLDALEARVRERLGDHLYAIGDEGLEETVGRILRDRGLTLAIAESCTGGLIGHRITEVAGSSRYFLLGVTAYSNGAKERLLEVSAETIERTGAVSRETVLEMARGVRRACDASIGLATSGIAGPDGGTVEKPVGTVWIAGVWDGGEWARRYEFGTRSRSWIKQIAAQTALDRLRRIALGETPSD